jgi:hypothetical protein
MDKVKKYEMFCHLRYLIKSSSLIHDMRGKKHEKTQRGG